jgi:predicted phosphodiesterase
MIKPDFIITADLHLRETKPICRTDDFFITQLDKLDFLKALQREYDIPIYCSGDILDSWNISPSFISSLIDFMPKITTVWGNHDLPYHNLKNKEKSALWTLYKAGKVDFFKDGHWNQDLNDCSGIEINDRKILFTHIMTWKNKKPFPQCNDLSTKNLLLKYDDFDCIVTGHNHQQFKDELDDRILINPGSFTIQSIAELHKPAVWLYYSETNTVKSIYLPFDESNITEIHKIKKENKENRLNAFIEKIGNDWEINLDFKKTISNIINKQNIDKRVEEIIMEGMEDETIY